MAAACGAVLRGTVALRSGNHDTRIPLLSESVIVARVGDRTKNMTRQRLLRVAFGCRR